MKNRKGDIESESTPSVPAKQAGIKRAIATNRGRLLDARFARGIAVLLLDAVVSNQWSSAIIRKSERTLAH
ncbi:MAG: hypothetical protein AB7P14_02895 [Blastocatellales bacterium]